MSLLLNKNLIKYGNKNHSKILSSISLSSRQHRFLSSSTTKPSAVETPTQPHPTLKKLPWLALYTALTFTLGYTYAKTEKKLIYPKGTPRSCSCDDSDEILTSLRQIVGSQNVITRETSQSPYLIGARLGHGKALAVVQPTTLQQAVSILQLCVSRNCVIIPQGSNTGLTGGSVPRSNQDRPSIVLSMKRIQKMYGVDDGRRILCTAGVGIADLSTHVLSTYQRESHSILGSTFLNPTVAAGIAFGSGGTQLRKGPAFTQRALYAKVDADGKIQVINRLGIKGAEGDALHWLDHLEPNTELVSDKTADGEAHASDVDYSTKVCDTESSEVARFNADTRGIEPNRCEGKVLTLATVTDTFPLPSSIKTYWISFPSLETALAFRKEVCLQNPADLPMSMEYMDRDSFDVVDRSGRIIATSIKWLGVTHPLIAWLWDLKLLVEGLPLPGAEVVCDKMLHLFNPLCPKILPKEIQDLGKTYDHHLQLEVGEYEKGSLSRFSQKMQIFLEKHPSVQVHECQAKERNALTAFRFTAATAFRTWCVGHSLQGISIDYALPKNCGKAPPILPSSTQPITRMRYSHFGCNVVHEDLAYGPEVDVHQEKYRLKAIVEGEMGGRLPAEHGHGIEYTAPEDARGRWMGMDPLNVMNPGIGGLDGSKGYKDAKR